MTVEWEPLVRLLSPHKLFRRAFLAEHGIRFPEGRRRLEDHVFVMRAYFAARRSRPGRLRVLPLDARSKDQNASCRGWSPVSYYGYLREVLDIIEANVEPGPLRDRLLAHWYRSKGLWRLEGAVFLRRDEGFNREIFDEVRKLALERFPPAVDRFMPFKYRIRSQLVRGDDFEGVTELARVEKRQRPDVRASAPRVSSGGLEVDLEARLTGLRYERDGDALRWRPPGSFPELDPALLDATRSVERGHVQVVVRAVADQTEYPVAVEQHVRLDPGKRPGIVRPVIVATARLDPRTAAAGAPLAAGEWQLVVVVRMGGFNATAMTLQPAGGGREAPVTFTVGAGGRIDRGPWLRRAVAGRLPRPVVRGIRRARASAGFRRAR